MQNCAEGEGYSSDRMDDLEYIDRDEVVKDACDGLLKHQNCENGIKDFQD